MTETGTNALPVIPELVEAMEKYPSVKEELFVWVSQISKDSPFEKDVIESLIRATSGKSRRDRVNAYAYLGLYPSQSERVLPVLINGLSDLDDYVFLAALTSLGKLGTNANKAAPELQKHIQHPKHQAMVIQTLKQLDPEAAVKAEAK